MGSGVHAREIFPLETLDLDWPGLRQAIAPLKQEVKRQQLWAARLDPQLGRQRWLRPLLAAETYSAFALTDNAGADPTELSTTAARDENSWIINGHKWFVSNAAKADFIIVVAVTDPDAAP